MFGKIINTVGSRMVITVLNFLLLLATTRILGVEGAGEVSLFLLDITLVMGAFTAALLSRQFHINRPPPLEYVWATFGGILMGVGATLAGGCTTGGFFVPLIFSSITER